MENPLKHVTYTSSIKLQVFYLFVLIKCFAVVDLAVYLESSQNKDTSGISLQMNSHVCIHIRLKFKRIANDVY